MYPTQLETFVALIGQVQRFLAPVDLRDRAIGATEDEPADGKRQLVATSAA